MCKRYSSAGTLPIKWGYSQVYTFISPPRGIVDNTVTLYSVEVTPEEKGSVKL